MASFNPREAQEDHLYTGWVKLLLLFGLALAFAFISYNGAIKFVGWQIFGGTTNGKVVEYDHHGGFVRLKIQWEQGGKTESFTRRYAWPRYEIPKRPTMRISYTDFPRKKAELTFIVEDERAMAFFFLLSCCGVMYFAIAGYFQLLKSIRYRRSKRFY